MLRVFLSLNVQALVCVVFSRGVALRHTTEMISTREMYDFCRFVCTPTDIFLKSKVLERANYTPPLCTSFNTYPPSPSLFLVARERTEQGPVPQPRTRTVRGRHRGQPSHVPRAGDGRLPRAAR